MPAAMPCKIRGGKYRETCRISEARKTKFACIVEADESMRKRSEGTLHKDHEDHNAGKGINSPNYYNLVHKFIPMPKAMKIPDATAAVDKEWENQENTSMAADESQKQKRGGRWSQGHRKNSTLCVVNGHSFVISRIRSWSHNFKNTKAEWYSEVTL